MLYPVAAQLLGGFVFGNTGVMLAILANMTPHERLRLAVGIVGAGDRQRRLARH